MSDNRPHHTAAERWSFLANASQRLAESDSYEQTLSTIAGMALPGHAEWSIVDLAEADGSIRRLAVVHPDPEKQIAAARLAAGWPPDRDEPDRSPAVMRTKAPQRTFRITDTRLDSVAGDETHLALLRQLGIASILTVPLLAGDQVLGAITFVSGGPGGAPREEDVAVAEDLAARCALAISRMRLVQELEGSLRLRDQVLGHVSHDLKNPLGAIVLSASHILAQAAEWPRDPRTEQWIEAAKGILSATDHMERLIGDLLEVARIGAGAVTIDLCRIEPSALVEDVREAYANGLASRSQRVETVVPEGLPTILADPGRLRQVFENLLENAAKFTPAGGTITLGAARLDGSVLFSVGDTGSGIPDEQMPRLFDRFWQARRQGAGSAGLGLTICKGIVEAHGGAIWAESVEGRGSTFYFRIPTGE